MPKYEVEIIRERTCRESATITVEAKNRTEARKIAIERANDDATKWGDEDRDFSNCTVDDVPQVSA